MEYCGGGICESQRRVYARVKRVGETLPHGNNAKGGVKSLLTFPRALDQCISQNHSLPGVEQCLPSQHIFIDIHAVKVSTTTSIQQKKVK